MARKIVSIANRQRLDVQIGGPGGANRLLIYTGIALLDGLLAMNNKLIHDDVDIILGPHSIADPTVGDNFAGAPFLSINAIGGVALAAINDLADSDNVTWSVDEAVMEEVFVDQVTRFLKIHTRVGYQGEGTGVLRLSYHAHVLAIAREPDAELQAFTLIPASILSASSDPATRVSRGTVTLQQPAPANGVTVKLSVQSPVPDIVSLPTDITIGPGQSSAVFDVTPVKDTFSTVDVTVLASCGSRGLAARLTVIGSTR